MKLKYFVVCLFLFAFSSDMEKKRDFLTFADSPFLLKKEKKNEPCEIQCFLVKRNPLLWEPICNFICANCIGN